MEDLLSAERLLAVWDTVYGWLLTNVFVLGNAVQAGLVALTLLLALLIAKRLKPWLARYREHRHVGRGVVIAESLAMSVVWLALLWLAMTVARRSASSRTGLLRTVVTLLAAWIAIHLASQFVRHRSWAKLISWAAWSIAALSILDLLEPTIARARRRGDSRLANRTSRCTTSSGRRSRSPCCSPSRCTWRA